MDNQFEKVTNISYGQNVKNSFGGVIFGVILFVVSFILLSWNEGNSVRLIQKEDFINKNAIVVNSDTINRSNDSKLIATSGAVYTDETLSDSMISVDKALNLKRKVEMYQWAEKQRTKETRNSGGGTTKTTTYTYEKKWDSRAHNSDNFEHPEYENPNFSIESKDMSVNNAKMGDFIIKKSQIEQIGKYQDVERLAPIDGYEIVDNYYYSGENFSSPEIGDIRISYQYVPSGAKISIVGQQNWDNTIGAMSTRGGQLYLQYDGIYSLDEMLNKFKQGNTLLTFGLRFAGWLVMFIGLQLLVNPIVTIARFVPLLSEIVNFISSFVLACISLVLSLITIAIAWFAYRPILTVILLIFAGMVVYYIKQYLQNKKNTKLSV